MKKNEEKNEGGYVRRDDTSASPHGRGLIAVIWVLLAAAVLAAIAVAAVMDLRASRAPEDSSAAAPVLTSAPARFPDDTLPAPVSTVPAETEVPGNGEDILTVLRSSDSPEALCAGEGADVRLRSLYDLHGLTVSESETQDLRIQLEAAVLSGVRACDLVVAEACPSGSRLLSGGYLQDLSEQGINLGPGTPGVAGGLTRSASFGGGIYLLFCDALNSDLGASTALLARGSSSVTSTLAASALEGKLTVERLFSDISEGKLLLRGTGDDGCLLAVFRGCGGAALRKNDSDVPEPVLGESAFADAYASASALIRAFSEARNPSGGEAAAAVLSPVSSGEWLPLPKVSADAPYVTPTDPAACAVLACPAGVGSGKRIARLIGALCECSVQRRSDAEKRIFSSGTPEELSRLILSSRSADASALFGWGDLEPVIAGYLRAGKNAAELAADKDVLSRIKAADAAAQIVRERLAG